MSKRSKTYFDFSLLLVIIILTLFGLMMIYSASSYTAQLQLGDPAYYTKRQAAIAAVGIVIMIIISFIDYHKIMKFAIPMYALSYALMIVTMTIGKEINGRKRWLQIGPLSFQPTEIVKIALIIFMAVLIVNMGNEIHEWTGLGKVLLFNLPIAALVAYNNLSSGIIVFMIAFVMAFIATDKKSPFVIGFVAIVLLVLLIEPMSTFFYDIGLLRPYQYSRIMVWLDPAAHPLDGGYQVLQGLYAIGSGGVTGKGLGGSIQKLGFVPEAQNDMIFSIICEEFGFIGAIAVMLIFLFLMYRILVIANSAPDKYGTLICVGVMAHISLQLILNIAVVANVIPNTGITLPFISYGGTSVLLLLAEMGLVFSVGRRIQIEKD